MPAEFAALPPNVSDQDTLLIAHFQEVAARLAAQGENLRAQYYVDYQRALAAGQPVVQGVAIGSGDARVTTTQERLHDGVVVSNLRATATNTPPRSEILEQPPAFARVERSPVHKSTAADTFARHVAASESPVIAQEPVERIGPIRVPSPIGNLLSLFGVHGRITTGYQSPEAYDARHQEVLGTIANGVARAAEQQIQLRAQELAGDPAFQEQVDAAVERITDDAQAFRDDWMLRFTTDPAYKLPVTSEER